MTDLTVVGALYAANGAPCHYTVVQGFLRNGTALELFTRQGWKPLIRARVIIDGEARVSLVTSDSSVYATRPDELLRVRFPVQKAGEIPHEPHRPDRGSR